MHLDFVIQCGLIPVDEQVMNVETLPVGLSMMSADSIVNPRGMNIWDFLVVKLRLGLAPVSSTYVGMQALLKHFETTWMPCS